MQKAEGKIEHRINREWCKGCGICIYFCPKQVFGFDDQGIVAVLKQEECIGCGTCERMCPDLAVEIFRSENTNGF